MEHKSEKAKETTPASTESKGVLGTVWSAAGALAETVTHAVQGTIEAAYQTADRIQQDTTPMTNKVAETANAAYDKTLQATENILGKEPEKKVDPSDAFFSSPTNDMIAATKTETTTTTTTEPAATTETILESAKKAVNDVVSGVTAKAADAVEYTKQAAISSTDIAKDSIANLSDSLQKTVISDDFKLELTMDVVAHLQRIADRTGDKILHETARKAHSACAKNLNEAPGVHLVRVTPEQATELVNLAILTQDHELADFARYCQSVAATTQIGIEPTPGKIQEELAKGRQELSQGGRMHTGPGYGAAFASVGRSSTGLSPSSSLSNIPQQPRLSPSNSLSNIPLPQQQQQQQPQQQQQQKPRLSPSNSFATIPQQEQAQQQQQQPQANANGMQLTMDMVAHIQRIADRTGDSVLHDTARKAHSACAKNLSDAPGVHLVSINPEQASELVNLAIRTQDHELANFARYCQSVAATTQLGIEPTPGKIMEEIAKGRQELQEQGRAHSGPGYGAAFASLSRSNSSSSLSRSNSSTSLSMSRGSSRSASPTNIPLASISRGASPTNVLLTASQEAQNLQLTMDVVAHLQRIADRTGDQVLHETARKAHSACAKGLNEAPGVHLTSISPEQATELVNLAIRTQDTELADFARYCQSVAATTQVAIEPTPGKILEEIEKGRQELQQQGRTHTGPGYGAAFASKSKTEVKVEPQEIAPAQSAVGQPSQ